MLIANEKEKGKFLNKCPPKNILKNLRNFQTSMKEDFWKAYNFYLTNLWLSPNMSF